MARTGEQAIAAGELLLGKYRVEETLGRGGMGIVVKARHMGLDEQVAIKLLRDDIAIDEETVQRFLREAQAAVKLKSEHVARITDVGRFDDGKPYMVMEFLQGADIGAMIDTHGGVAPQQAVDLLIQACDALAEAHSLGIIHRDIKPSNLFVTFRPDGTPILKVLDFGISKSASGQDLSLTQTQSMLGTPAYMSPEQMRSARKVDARTDIWSLGSVLYEAIEGELPFKAESFSEMCVMVAVDPPTPMRKTPPEVQPVILKCLAKHPDGRYPSVADLAADLVRFSADPQRARMLVERMFRTLGRRAHAAGGVQSSGNFDVITGTAVPVYQPNVQSAPIAVPQVTLDPRSAPHLAPSGPSKKWWIAIPLVLVVVIVVAIVASRSTSSPAGAALGSDIASGSGSASDATAGSIAGSAATAAGVGGTAGGSAGTAGTSSAGVGGTAGGSAGTAGKSSAGVGGTAGGSSAVGGTAGGGTGVGGNAATAGGSGVPQGGSGVGATGSDARTGSGGATGSASVTGGWFPDRPGTGRPGGGSGKPGLGTIRRPPGTGSGSGSAVVKAAGSGSAAPAAGSGSAKALPACDPFSSRKECKK